MPKINIHKERLLKGSLDVPVNIFKGNFFLEVLQTAGKLDSKKSQGTVALQETFYTHFAFYLSLNSWDLNTKTNPLCELSNVITKSSSCCL